MIIYVGTYIHADSLPSQGLQLAIKLVSYGKGSEWEIERWIKDLAKRKDGGSECKEWWY